MAKVTPSPTPAPAGTGTAEPFDLALALNDFFNATQDGNKDAGQIAQDEIIDAFATLTRQLAEAQQREQALREAAKAVLGQWDDGRLLYLARDETVVEDRFRLLRAALSVPTTPDREG